MRERGTVIRFNNAKGHGIIRSSERGDDLFVSFAYIEAPPGAFRSLAEGQTVEFDRVQSPGPRPYNAMFVRVVPTDEKRG